jgi:hypothetical protein
MAAFEGKKILIVAPRRLGTLAGGEYFFALGLDYAITDDPHLKQKFGTEEMLRRIVENANANGVSVYPLFPPGLTTTLPDASRHLRTEPAVEHLNLLNETLAQTEIAARTGGLSAAGAVNIVRLVPQIRDDVSDYYSLAFRGGPVTSDRAREVVVKTKNPDYVVRARQQYVEKTDATRMKDRVAAELMLDEHGDFQITVEPAPVEIAAGQRTLRAKVLIPIAALTTVPQGDGRHSGSFSVFVAAGDRRGAFSEVTRKTQPFDIAEKDLEAAQDGTFTYNLDMAVDKNTDRIAIGVLDDVSKEYALTKFSVPRP